MPAVGHAGEYPRTTAAGAARWANPDQVFGGKHRPCINGQQHWDSVSALHMH